MEDDLILKNKDQPPILVKIIRWTYNSGGPSDIRRTSNLLLIPVSKLQKSQDLEFFLILQRVRLDVDDDHASCISFFLNMIVFIMILNFLFRKHLKLQKSQYLEFFWFFNESELMLMMITLVAFCFSDTWTWLFSLRVLIFFSANTWNYKNYRIRIFFWFFIESELMWMMITLVAFHYQS